MITSKKKNFIIECLPTTIRVARLSSRMAPLSVEEILEVDRSDPEAADSQIRKFAGVKPNAYMNGRCSVYPSNRIVRKVKIESPKGKESDFVLDFVKNDVNVDPEEVKLFCLSAGDGIDRDIAGYNKKEVLVCGASIEEIEEIQKDLLSNAIFPNTLEIGTVGIIGVLKDMMAWAKKTEPMMYLEIEPEFTNAIIVGPNGVEITRKIEFGSRNIAASLKAEMSLKDDEAAAKLLGSAVFDFGSMANSLLHKLLRELQSSIGFFEVQTGQTVASVFCMRREGRLKWLESSVCEMLNVEQFDLNMRQWMDSKGIDLAEKASLSSLDLSWMGFFALMCEFGEGRDDQ